MNYPRLGIAIELGQDWQVNVDPETGSLKAFRGGIDADSASAGLFVGLKNRDPSIDPATQALRIMKPHTGRGEPEEIQSELNGRPAFGYRWTDGLGEVLTWLVPTASGDFLEVEFSFCGRRHSFYEGGLLEEAHQALLSLKWLNQ
ncbi:MAG TPA: hypothetical protein VKT78_07920 [Fimbriimonadaceae bacterium]|nr:hypothetical protein [Fimbriimonadaceae bacterium]